MSEDTLNEPSDLDSVYSEAKTNVASSVKSSGRSATSGHHSRGRTSSHTYSPKSSAGRMAATSPLRSGCSIKSSSSESHSLQSEERLALSKTVSAEMKATAHSSDIPPAATLSQQNFSPKTREASQIRPTLTTRYGTRDKDTKSSQVDADESNRFPKGMQTYEEAVECYTKPSGDEEDYRLHKLMQNQLIEQTRQIGYICDKILTILANEPQPSPTDQLLFQLATVYRDSTRDSKKLRTTERSNIHQSSQLYKALARTSCSKEMLFEEVYMNLRSTLRKRLQTCAKRLIHLKLDSDDPSDHCLLALAKTLSLLSSDDFLALES